MIQALGRNETLRQELVADRAAVYARFGLCDKDIQALSEGSISAMANIGVHPMYRMHWMMFSNPEAAGHLSVAEYIDKTGAGTGNG